MANTVRIDFLKLNFWTTNSNYTIGFTEGLAIQVGGNKSPSPAVSTVSSFTSFAQGPIASSSLNGTTDQLFYDPIPVSYDRFVSSVNTLSNFYLYEDTTTTDILLKTIPVSQLTFTTGSNALSVPTGRLERLKTYYLLADFDICKDIFNFPSPAVFNDTVIKFTLANGQTVVQVNPTFGSTTLNEKVEIFYGIGAGSARLINENISGKNYYLYKQTTSTNELIATIASTGTRITLPTGFPYGKITIDLNGLIVPETTYYITSDDGCHADEYGFLTYPISDDTVVKFTTAGGARINSTVPPYDQSNDFVSTVTLNYSKTLTLGTGSYYLNRLSTSTQRIIPVNSSSVTLTGTSTVKIVLNDQTLPEDTYWITNDTGIWEDQNGLEVAGISDQSLIRWNNASIKNMTDRFYKSNLNTYALFTATTPIIVDNDLDVNKIYTFKLSSPIGYFTNTNTGTNISGEWTMVGTKAALNSVMTLTNFVSTVTLGNAVSTYSYSLSKNSSTLVSKSYGLIGLPVELAPIGLNGLPVSIMELVVGTPRVINENILVTATITTSTVMGGTVTFKDGATVLTTATMSSSGTAIANIVIASTGTKFITAVWNGGILPNGNNYSPISSGVTQITVVTATNLLVSSTSTELATVDLSISSSTVTRNVSVAFTATFNTTPALSTGSGIVSFNNISEILTSTTYTSATAISIISTGAKNYTNFWNNSSTWTTGSNYFVRVNNAYNITATDWLTISGNVTGIGKVKSTYEVQSIQSGTYVILSNRKEDSDSSYAYNPLILAQQTATTFDSIIFPAQFTRQDYVRTATTSLGTATVVNNIATFNSTLSEGTYLIAADWGGTTNPPKYLAITSNRKTQSVVNLVSATILVDLPINFPLYNQDNTLNTGTVTATITVLGPYATHAPTGQVTLTDDVLGVINTATLTASTGTSSVATITWSPYTFGQTLGGINLTASYNGDEWNRSNSLNLIGNATSSTIGSSGFNVIKSIPNIILSLNTSSDVVGSTMTISLQKGADSVLTGTVSLFINDALTATTVLSTTATFTVSDVYAAGTYNIRAEYPETLYHNSATFTQVFTATKINPVITLTNSTATYIVGAGSSTITATKQAGDRLFGNYNILLNGVVTTSTPFVNNVITYTTSLADGTYVITGRYDEDFYSNTSTQTDGTIIVRPYQAPTVSVSYNPTAYTYYNQDNTTASSLVTATITVTGAWETPTGSITFSKTGTNFVNTLTLIATTGKSASTTTTWLPYAYNQDVGTQTFVVSYPGDYWNTTTSINSNYNIIKAVPELSFSSAAVNSTYAGLAGYPLQLFANKSLSSVMTGTVTFKDFTRNITLGTGTFGVSNISIPFANDTSTYLLLHGENYVNSGSTALSIVATGTISISTSTFRFGTGSYYFDGNISGNIYVPYNSNQEFGSGDWTIEFWYYRLSGIGSSAVPICQWGLNANQQSWFIRDGDGGQFVWYDGTGNKSIRTNISQDLNVWHHYAYVRNGSSLKVYQDGVETTSTSISGSMSNNTALYGIALGYNPNAPTNSAFVVKGYIDEVRISKGIARYTSNFIPPGNSSVSITIRDTFTTGTNISYGFEYAETQYHSKYITSSTISFSKSNLGTIAGKYIYFSDYTPAPDNWSTATSIRLITRVTGAGGAGLQPKPDGVVKWYVKSDYSGTSQANGGKGKFLTENNAVPITTSTFQSSSTAVVGTTVLIPYPKGANYYYAFNFDYQGDHYYNPVLNSDIIT